MCFYYLNMILETVMSNSVFNREMYSIKLYFTVQNSLTVYKDQFQFIQSFLHTHKKIPFGEKNQNARIHHCRHCINDA